MKGKGKRGGKGKGGKEGGEGKGRLSRWRPPNQNPKYATGGARYFCWEFRHFGSLVD